MDIDDPIEIRIGANDDDFVLGMDQAEKRLYDFKNKLESINLPSLDEMMGMGKGQGQKTYANNFDAFTNQMLGAAQNLKAVSMSVSSSVMNLDRALGGKPPEDYARHFTAHADQMVGAAQKMGSAAIAANAARFDMNAALGMGGGGHGDPSRRNGEFGSHFGDIFGYDTGGKTGASQDQLDAMRKLQSLRFDQGGTTGASQAQLNALKQLGVGGGRKPKRPPPGGMPDEEEGGFQWDWMSSILGGIGGRTFGGHLAGLGGMLGGGVGGPIGAVVGAGAGMGVHAITSALEKMKDVGIAAFHGIAQATEWALGKMIHLGMEYERRITTFQIMTGSKEAGNKLYGDIMQLGINTPYTTRDLSAQGEVLLGYGQATNQVVPTLGRLGDIAGGDPDRLRRLTLAFGQVLAHGRLQGQELRQFAEAGVGNADFAASMGMSGDEFKKAMHSGDIGANAMIKTINRLTSGGGRFAGASEAQMGTVSGAWSNIVERAELAGGQAGLGMFKELDVANNINSAADAMGKLAAHTGEFTDWLGKANKELDPFKTAFHAIRDESIDLFSGVFDSAPKWDELGGKIKGWATEVVATFLTVEQAIKAIPDAVEGASNLMGWMSGVGIANKASKAVGGPSAGAAAGWAWRHLTVPGMIGEWFGDELTETQNTNRESASQMMGRSANNRNMNKWAGYMDGLFSIGHGGKPIKEIGDPFIFDPKVKKYADHENDRWENGDRYHPLERFEHKSGMIAKMFSQDENNKGVMGAKRALGAIGSIASMFGAISGNRMEDGFLDPTIQGGLAMPQMLMRAFGQGANTIGILGKGGQTQQNRLRLDAYQELERSMSHSHFETPAALMGSSAAIDTINRSNMDQDNTMQKVLAVLEAAKLIQDQQKDIEQQQLDALNAFVLKGI